MRPLTDPNIESELSYAYLHAVASRAGMGCEVRGRAADGNGIDARLTSWGPFPADGLKEIDLNVQLKATVSTPTDDGVRLSYFLAERKRYDDLRAATQATPRILVVLFLPQDDTLWVAHSANELILRRCAYWVSLRGAAATTNASGVTVYLPKSQVFDVAGLQGLATVISQGAIPDYQP